MDIGRNFFDINPPSTRFQEQGYIVSNDHVIRPHMIEMYIHVQLVTVAF